MFDSLVVDAKAEATRVIDATLGAPHTEVPS
jgi:hypothetical protein